MTEPFIANQTLDAVLILSHGDFFLGKGIGIPGKVEGEICFNTGITGYQETLTDPSFAGQLITFTFPHIGNVGTTSEDAECDEPFCNGLILREPITEPSNFRSQEALIQWLLKHQMTGISGIDTRALTRLIRNKGACHALIFFAQAGEPIDIPALRDAISAHPDLSGQELTQAVSTPTAYPWTQHTFELGQTTFKEQTHYDYHVVAMDFGIKKNILRLLVDAGFKVTVVPSTATLEEIMQYAPDGVFLSNGPGDPHETGKFTTPVLQALLAQNIPIFGICLGHQLLGIASGLTTRKMHQGHRGANQPVKDLQSGKVYITSQNHGFCIDVDPLPPTVEITHVSLFDGSNEGLRRLDKPAFSVQFHPESSPGPHDTRYLFSQFKSMIQSSVLRKVTHAKA